MASNLFKVKVFTPSGLLQEDETDAAQLPTAVGEIGILPQHTNYTGVLSAGEMRYISTRDSKSKSISITGGFCTFGDETLVVLADAVA